MKPFSLDLDPQLEVCPDKAFDTPLGNHRPGPIQYPELNLDAPQGAEALMRRLLAGYRRPTLDDVKNAIRFPHDAPPPLLHLLGELFSQLDPLEMDSLMRDVGGSPREVAALMRRTRVGKPILVTWINQFADDPDWHDSDALTVCLGEWCRTRVANRQLPADDGR